jgi:hypothetical protein
LIKFDNLSSNILKLKDENNSLKNEISSFHKRIDTHESKPNNILLNALFDLLHESEDKKSRASNILIFNVSENANENIDSMVSLTKEFFSALQVPLSPATVSRIGKIGSKPRPLEIELNNPGYVHYVLKLKIQLRNLDAWKHVGIFTDMTAYQWSLVVQLKLNIAARSNTGDNHWIILYKNKWTPYLGTKN